MFLLILASAVKSIFNLHSFTFHYVSTYTFLHLFQISAFHKIYIPLCFYLYGNIIYHQQSEVWIYIPLCFYLYSAEDPQRNNVASIYIPLCFYLYGNLLSFTWTTHLIYIPLCFYLYRNRSIRSNQMLRIYIPLCFYLYRVSEYSFCVRSDLHSTMFLLIPEAGSSQRL